MLFHAVRAFVENVASLVSMALMVSIVFSEDQLFFTYSRAQMGTSRSTIAKQIGVLFFISNNA